MSSTMALKPPVCNNRSALIVNLAAWAQRPEVQQAFPDIQSTLSGASKAEELVGLHLTDRGWEVL